MKRQEVIVIIISVAAVAFAIGFIGGAVLRNPKRAEYQKLVDAEKQKVKEITAAKEKEKQIHQTAADIVLREIKMLDGTINQLRKENIYLLAKNALITHASNRRLMSMFTIMEGAFELSEGIVGKTSPELIAQKKELSELKLEALEEMRKEANKTVGTVLHDPDH